MGVTIYLGAYFGGVLDDFYNLKSNSFSKGFTFISVIISMYLFIKQAQNINNDG